MISLNNKTLFAILITCFILSSNFSYSQNHIRLDTKSCLKNINEFNSFPDDIFSFCLLDTMRICDNFYYFSDLFSKICIEPKIVVDKLALAGSFRNFSPKINQSECYHSLVLGINFYVETYYDDLINDIGQRSEEDIYNILYFLYADFYFDPVHPALKKRKQRDIPFFIKQVENDEERTIVKVFKKLISDFESNKDEFFKKNIQDTAQKSIYYNFEECQEYIKKFEELPDDLFAYFALDILLECDDIYYFRDLFSKRLCIDVKTVVNKFEVAGSFKKSYKKNSYNIFFSECYSSLLMGFNFYSDFYYDELEDEIAKRSDSQIYNILYFLYIKSDYYVRNMNPPKELLKKRKEPDKPYFIRGLSS